MIEVTSVEHYNDLLENEFVFVDFHATWCGPCKRVAPFIEELSKKEEYTNVTFCKVNIDDVPDLADKYEIMAVPTFVFIKEKEEKGKLEGANEDEIVKRLNDLIKTDNEA